MPSGTLSKLRARATQAHRTVTCPHGRVYTAVPLQLRSLLHFPLGALGWTECSAFLAEPRTLQAPGNLTRRVNTRTHAHSFSRSLSLNPPSVMAARPVASVFWGITNSGLKGTESARTLAKRYREQVSMLLASQISDLHRSISEELETENGETARD